MCFPIFVAWLICVLFFSLHALQIFVLVSYFVGTGWNGVDNNSSRDGSPITIGPAHNRPISQATPRHTMPQHAQSNKSRRKKIFSTNTNVRDCIDFLNALIDRAHTHLRSVVCEFISQCWAILYAHWSGYRKTSAWAGPRVRHKCA